MMKFIVRKKATMLVSAGGDTFTYVYENVS
jgi:hypothetical protein